MTMGELAELMNADEHLYLRLEDRRMYHYDAKAYFDETGLIWWPPSPNLRTVGEAVLYPGVALLEATNVSVGRGTDTPFEVVGAPWMEKADAWQEMELARKLVDGLRTVEGVKLYCCDNLDNHLSTILMNLEGVDPANVGVMLNVDYNIATRTGLHCAPLVHRQLGTEEADGGVRFSVGAFNTEADVAAAVAAVADIAQWARERQAKNQNRIQQVAQ